MVKGFEVNYATLQTIKVMILIFKWVLKRKVLCENKAFLHMFIVKYRHLKTFTLVYLGIGLQFRTVSIVDFTPIVSMSLLYRGSRASFFYYHVV